MKKFFIFGFIFVLGFILLSVRSQTVMEEKSIEPAQSLAARAPAQALSQDPKVKLIQEIASVKDCYQTQKCNYPQTDPRSYEFAVGRDLAQKLSYFHDQFRKDPSAQNELKRLARESIKVEDGFVQSAALDMFKDLPVDPDNLTAIEQGMINNSDPLIAEKALTELQRFMGTAQEADMQRVVQGMVTGAHFASQSVGENILPFINDQSFPNYESIYRGMPAGSRVARDLATALHEFRRRRTGG